MKIIFFKLIGLLLLFSIAASAQQHTIVDYFPLVDSLSQYPPIDQELAILYHKKIDRWHVSFIGPRGQTKVMIAAVTLTPLTSAKDISLIVKFHETDPTIGGVSTWGYVFDRNNDGKIDYLALVGGAAAFKQNDFPEDFPTHPPYTRPQIELFVSHCRLIFDHWADDNFDGSVDAAVHIDMDSLGRDWVDRWILARSTHFDGQLDDAWAFHQSINEDQQPITHTVKSIPYRAVTKQQETLTLKSFGESNGILHLLNKAAKACKLTQDSFIHPEVKE